MINKFKKYMPSRESIRKNKSLGFLSKFLDKKELWDFNDKISIATAVAIGFFAAFIFPLGQFALAAVLCVLFKANLPVALTGTLITNPLTFGPWQYISYQLGSMILSLFNYHDARPKSFEFEFTWESFNALGLSWITGVVALSVILPIVGYLLVIICWDFYNKVISHR